MTEQNVILRKDEIKVLLDNGLLDTKTVRYRTVEEWLPFRDCLYRGRMENLFVYERLQ